VSTSNTPNLWEIRKALKPFLTDQTQTILFGCSGGADSMALAIALLAEYGGEKAIPVVVDHGLQPNSDQITAKVAAQLKTIGYKRVETAVAQVIFTDGLEASARRARYKIFHQFIDC